LDASIAETFLKRFAEDGVFWPGVVKEERESGAEMLTVSVISVLLGALVRSEL